MDYNTTPIQNLPDLNELENMEANLAMTRGLPPSEMDKYSKAIRNPHIAPSQAGMGSYTGTYQSVYQPQVPKEYYSDMLQPPQVTNCIDAASHVQACPVCSQLYKKDNIPYIIAIIVLVILVIILFNKVLNA